MAHLARINLYPVKSLDGQGVERAVLLPSGALEDDRRFALKDREGRFVNGKRSPEAHRLRSRYDSSANRLTLEVEGSQPAITFDVSAQRRELGDWLTNYFGIELELVEDRERGFPDDPESPGPTILSTATLEEVASWFEGMTVDEARQRFRANLEIDGVEAFWEDRLVAEAGRCVRFRIGEADLLGTNPCQRCAVPTRHPRSGQTTREFAKTFARRRQERLPEWAPAGRFDHFYRLAVNTRPATEGRSVLRVGDEVRVLGVV